MITIISNNDLSLCIRECRNSFLFYTLDSISLQALYRLFFFDTYKYHYVMLSSFKCIRSDVLYANCLEYTLSVYSSKSELKHILYILYAIIEEHNEATSQ